jgi:hypothetical protein
MYADEGAGVQTMLQLGGGNACGSELSPRDDTM